MRIGTYGYKIPETADESSVDWCVNNSFNFDRLDTHNHDGVNSAPIALSIAIKETITLASGDWVLDSDGIYYQDFNIPSGASYENTIMQFMELAGDTLALETEWVGPSVYGARVFCNDNSLDVKVIFV